MQGSVLEACRTPRGGEEGENSFLDLPAYEKEEGNIPVPSDPLLFRSSKSSRRAGICGT